MERGEVITIEPVQLNESRICYFFPGFEILRKFDASIATKK